ncbi:hypothetical protein F5B19DRAFT_157321 [Rostrohypoxylon terebratum]|nr:hypothetical protein F5B19DRAFT_157321 [Rostrohypoxylon terebratum]
MHVCMSVRLYVCTSVRLYVCTSVSIWSICASSATTPHPPKRSFLDPSEVFAFSYLDVFRPISRSGICAVKSFPAFPPRTFDVAHFIRGIFVLRYHAAFTLRHSLQGSFSLVPCPSRLSRSRSSDMDLLRGWQGSYGSSELSMALHGFAWAPRSAYVQILPI